MCYLKIETIYRLLSVLTYWHELWQCFLIFKFIVEKFEDLEAACRLFPCLRRCPFLLLLENGTNFSQDIKNINKPGRTHGKLRRIFTKLVFQCALYINKEGNLMLVHASVISDSSRKSYTRTRRNHLSTSFSRKGHKWNALCWVKTSFRRNR